MARRGLTLSVIVGGLAVLGLAAGCKKPPPPLPPTTVLFAPAIQQDLSLSAEYVGTIDGYVTIDPAEYIAAVAQAKGSLARAQATYGQTKVTAERYKPLAAKQAVSQQDL